MYPLPSESDRQLLIPAPVSVDSIDVTLLSSLCFSVVDSLMRVSLLLLLVVNRIRGKLIAVDAPSDMEVKEDSA
jgi:hypothetical protein